jgi:putative two-component system response regulator
VLFTPPDRQGCGAGNTVSSGPPFGGGQHKDALDMNQSGPVRGHILAVDDQQPNLTLVTQMLEAEGHVVRTAGTGLSALEAIDRQPPDLILLDVGLPDINGFEVCRRLKHNPLTRLIPVVMVTGLNSREHRIEGINAGADDFLGKPFDSGELRARVGSLLRLKRYTDDLESAESVILSLALTVEARDPYTDGHCQRLAEYASALGRELGLSTEEVAALHRGGYLHDVGKIGIADAILQKPTTLNAAEYALMKAHTLIGDRLCGNLRSLALVRPIVRHHHELLNGSGYPDGLAGDQIPLLAQIVGVVDAYDAMTTSRPYREALSAEAAHEELRRDVVRGWRRRDLVEVFLGLARRGLTPSAVSELLTVGVRSRMLKSVPSPRIPWVDRQAS